jgi:hypothetical protein
MTTITKRFAFGIAMALALGLATLAQESNASPTRNSAHNGESVTSDQTFIKEAADGGLAEAVSIVSFKTTLNRCHSSSLENASLDEDIGNAGDHLVTKLFRKP